MHHYAIAEIEFEYSAGRIKAGFPDDSFIINIDEKAVRQQRDLVAEKKHIDELIHSVKSMQRISKLPKSKRPAFDDITENSIVYADPMAWVEQLVPENKIEGLGWKVEHTLDSQFNLSATQNLQLSLNESEKKQDWFNVGATIQDMNGNTYNLIDLLGYAIQHNPHLLEDDYIEKMDSDSFLIVHLREAQTQLALRNQEIKPILIYLKEILRHPESATLDQYDAAQFLDLQHHLGMPWRTNERLKIFAEKLQNSYQDQICTPQGFQGELRATGDVFKDVLNYMKRSGFDTFVIKEGKDILEAAAGLNDFRNPYQASTAVAQASYQTGA